MSKKTLETIAEAVVADGKGILAADESTSTIKKRFDSINVELPRKAVGISREMLFRTEEAMRAHISGVILLMKPFVRRPLTAPL